MIDKEEEPEEPMEVELDDPKREMIVGFDEVSKVEAVNDEI